jgi:uncharacterized protein (TIGR00251 family)
MALTIAVTVKPRAKTERVVKVNDGEFVVSVHAPPQGGKANQALVELLADHFSVPKSAIKIVRGHSSRKKLVSIG